MATQGSIIIDDDSVKNRHIAPTAAIDRDKLAQRVLGIDNIDLSRLRTWDARATNLPGTASADDLAYVTGTLGTDMPTIQAGDIKTTSSTRYAGFTVQLPYDYEDGETVTLRINAGMKTTVADGSCTVDAQVYLNSDTGSVGSDICATAAQSINNLTAADKDFTITASTLTKGAILDVRVAIIYVDTATVTAVIPRINSIKLLTDRR